MERPKVIKPRDREAIIRSLRSGVVPSTGLQHIQVGRAGEIASLIRDIDTVAAGGSVFRVVIGEYGSGKTFFLSLVRSMALERGLVTMHADLTPERRLHGSGGQARRLLADLVASLSTRTVRDGGGVAAVLSRLSARADAEGCPAERLLEPLRELPMGDAFARVAGMYCAPEATDEVRGEALRWLRAEVTTRTDAMRGLGVREFLTDADFFAGLRLYGALARAAGYKGLMVTLDEMVNLYKIANAVARRANYEEILAMLNATLQGRAEGLGIVLGGTPEFLTDTRRGLYSYEALRSRLAENTLSGVSGLRDYDSTVLRLPNLTREELYVLLKNLRRVYGSGREGLEARVGDDVLSAYMAHCFERVGESYFRTPRNTIKGFLDLLALMEQYPDRAAGDILPQVSVKRDEEASGMSLEL